MEVKRNIKPIIVTGCPRSGTTLLRTMLDRNSDLQVHPGEPQYILGLYQRFGYYVRDVPSALSYIANHQYLPESVNIETLKVVLGKARTMPLKDLINRYLCVWGGERLNSLRPVLKDPRFIYNLDLVSYLFDNVTIIHIIRDPRGNVSSQRTRWPKRSIWECSMLWRKSILVSQEWARHTKVAYIELKYEDLLEDPEKVLMHLCKAIGITYTSNMLTFNQKEEVFVPGESPKITKFKSADATRRFLWKERFSPVDIQLIEHCCWREMKLMGYELSRPSVPKVDFMAKYIKNRIHYCFFKNVNDVKRKMRIIGWRLCWRLGFNRFNY